eukprot:681885-Pelagomonas_calceolata.AAC.1
MAVLDVQFMKLPGWSCVAPYFFITSHTRVTREKRLQSRRLTASLLINTNETGHPVGDVEV